MFRNERRYPGISFLPVSDGSEPQKSARFIIAAVFSSSPLRLLFLLSSLLPPAVSFSCHCLLFVDDVLSLNDDLLCPADVPTDADEVVAVHRLFDRFSSSLTCNFGVTAPNQTTFGSSFGC